MNLPLDPALLVPPSRGFPAPQLFLPPFPFGGLRRDGVPLGLYLIELGASLALLCLIPAGPRVPSPSWPPCPGVFPASHFCFSILFLVAGE